MIGRFLRRRDFLSMASALVAAVTQGRRQARAQRVEGFEVDRVKHRQPYIAIQVPAVSFVDEGIDQVLDILQERAYVNTIWLNTYTYGRGTGGRQVPGYPIPDYGVQEYDLDYHGGPFYNYDKRYFCKTILDDFRAPDYERRDILAEVLPKAKARGMDVVVWDYNNAYRVMPARMPNLIDVYGRRVPAGCFNNEDFRNHLLSKIEDYLKTYPEIDGIAWGCERMGPLMNLIGGGWTIPYVSCFCPDCRAKAHERGINVERAKRGYLELIKLFRAAREDKRPTDGYFVTFWRLLNRYPEILAWEALWTDSYHEMRAELYGVAKSIAIEKPFGFHIMHNHTLSPFYRAEEDFSETKNYCDFLKVVVYNNCVGPRMVRFLKTLHSNILHDAEPEDFIRLYYKIMNYEEAPYHKLATTGLSPDYVYREIKRALEGVGEEVKVYAGIDIDIPTEPGEKQTTPEDVREAVKAA